MKRLHILLYCIEAVAHQFNIHWTKEAALPNGMQIMSGHKSNPPVLQTLTTSMTSAANQLVNWKQTEDDISLTSIV